MYTSKTRMRLIGWQSIQGPSRSRNHWTCPTEIDGRPCSIPGATSGRSRRAKRFRIARCDKAERVRSRRQIPYNDRHGPSVTGGRHLETREPTMIQDAQGHHLSGATAETVAAYDRAVQAFNLVHGGAVGLFDTARE